jgi:hypothetical protein
VKLAFILYYDGLGTTNQMGAFAHKHSLGLFYYALINLEPSIRMALPYIQLVTVAYESDIKHFGMELVISGPLDEDEETGTSYGACMRRLVRAEGITIQVPKSDGQGYEDRRFRGGTILVAADHPAAAKMLSCKEIGAKLPCRCCNWDQGTSAQDAPAAYGRPSSFCSAGAPSMGPSTLPVSLPLTPSPPPPPPHSQMQPSTHGKFEPPKRLMTYGPG